MGKKLSLKEQIWNEFLPEALKVGVSFDLFWSLTPFKLKPFIKAYEGRIHTESWLMGAYVYSALQSLVPVLVAFPEKGAKPLPYLEKPLNVLMEEREQSEADEKRIENERLKAFYAFSTWSKAVKDKIENKN